MDIPNRRPWLVFLFCLPSALLGANTGTPESWIPARWQGGPLELAQRAKAKTLPAETALRDALANWYDAATLGLLDGSPVNCLLVTWSAGAAAELEQRQQALVKAYAGEAHKRGVAVLGLVYSGADPAKAAAAAADAQLDGLVFDGDFRSLCRNTKAWGDQAIAPATPAVGPREGKGPVLAIEGVQPNVRNLSDMGIRAGPSAEPWIDSNVWLVRSFRLGPAWRPIWVSYEPDGGRHRIMPVRGGRGGGGRPVDRGHRRRTARAVAPRGRCRAGRVARPPAATSASPKTTRSGAASRRTATSRSSWIRPLRLRRCRMNT